MITPGRKSEVNWDKGNWIFLDIGFSSNGKTCGLAFADESPRDLQFGEARNAIVGHIRKQNGSINLVIEAPLSVCFDSNRNPKGRKIEKRGSKTRYWYTGLGCAVMTAATYLIRDIHEATKDLPNIEVNLFEGFVSFKEGRTDHKKDVSALRKKVKIAQQHLDSICDSEDLKLCESDEIFSAFRVAGLDCGVPTVIIA
ncbi:MAG: hypothetical protein ABSC47_09860 [Terracidiphilus sp.]|jgi:hypothetical protein